MTLRGNLLLIAHCSLLTTCIISAYKTHYKAANLQASTFTPFYTCLRVTSLDFLTDRISDLLGIRVTTQILRHHPIPTHIFYAV